MRVEAAPQVLPGRDIIRHHGIEMPRNPHDLARRQPTLDYDVIVLLPSALKIGRALM